MNEMVERVAEAIFSESQAWTLRPLRDGLVAIHTSQNGEQKLIRLEAETSEGRRHHFYAMRRAAIATAAMEAMREPTEAMIAQSWSAPPNDLNDHPTADPQDYWRHMIDAALNPKNAKIPATQP